MTDRTDTDGTEQFTARVHRQHNSLVITVPKRLCELQGVVAGSILVFECWSGSDKVLMGKLSPGGYNNAGDRGNSDVS